jgi:hypothetical protein
VTPTKGAALTFSTAGAWQLLEGLASGDTVRVTYSKVDSELIAHTVTVTGTTQSGVPAAGG